MKITRKELLEKAHAADAGDGCHFDRGALAAARALGHEVPEEPELPERLQPLLRWPDAPAAMVWVRFLLPDGSEPLNSEEQLDALATELALRYNAKAEVLKVAKELISVPTAQRSFAASQRLRAAYEKEKP